MPIKNSLPISILQALSNPVLMDLNIEEAENLLRAFGTRFEMDRSPYKLLKHGCKYGFLRASLDFLIIFAKDLTLLLPTTFITNAENFWNRRILECTSLNLLNS